MIASLFCVYKSSTIFERHSAHCHHYLTPYYPHVALQGRAWVHTVLYYGQVWGVRAWWKAKPSPFSAGRQPDGVCALRPKSHTADVRCRGLNFGSQLKLMTASDKGVFSKRVTGGSRLSSLQPTVSQTSNLLSLRWHNSKQQVILYTRNVHSLTMNICWQRHTRHHHYGLTTTAPLTGVWSAIKGSLLTGGNLEQDQAHMEAPSQQVLK